MLKASQSGIIYIYIYIYIFPVGNSLFSFFRGELGQCHLIIPLLCGI
jgi:hypothetical protein